MSQTVEAPTQERELLDKIRGALKPLDAKIDHALAFGDPRQIEADLIYIRRLLDQIVAAIDETLA